MMLNTYQRFHASCMRREDIPEGPGELIVSLPGPVRFVMRCSELIEPTEVIHEHGIILHVDVDLPSVRDAVALHLNGTAVQSEIRFGVGLLIGLKVTTCQPGLPRAQEELIDNWLDTNATFAFRLFGSDDDCILQPDPIGLFNGAMRLGKISWENVPVRH